MEKTRRSPYVTLLATLAVLGLLVFTVQRAYATVTVPNAKKESFSVPAGLSSGLFPIASFNTPVQINIAVVSPSTQASVVPIHAVFANLDGGNRLQYVGYNSPSNTWLRNSISGNGTSVAAVLKTGIDVLVKPGPGGTPTHFQIRNTTQDSVYVIVTQSW